MYYIRFGFHILSSFHSRHSLKMEEYMKKLVEHSEPKPSYHIIVTGGSSKLKTIYNPPLTFPEGACSYEMALIKLETYYSFPNVKSTNNALRVSLDDGKTWKLIEIPVGCYEITDINKELQRLITSVGGKSDRITFSPNLNTLRCMLDIKDENYRVDFNVKNSIRKVLGFDAKIYSKGRHEGEQLVNILDVNSILVNCDVIGASRVNGKEAPVIHNFFPNVGPGEKIVETPKNLIYVPIMLNVISQMTVWVTDQSGKELDLQGEELTITFHIKSC